MIIAILGGMAVLLGCLILVTQIQINQAHQRLLEQSKTPVKTSSSSSSGGAGAGADGNNPQKTMPKTKVKSDPTKKSDLYMAQQPQNLPHGGNARVTAAQAYWNQFQGVSPVEAKPWTPLEEQSFEFRRELTSSELLLPLGGGGANTNYSNVAETKLFLLKQAAQLGHPQAQHVYANALASGVLPLHYDQTKSLEVADDFMETHTRQQQEAWLNWHMAATSGNVEAAMALGHRYDTLQKQGDGGSGSNSKKQSKKTQKTDTRSFQCSDVLPYYQAAAHGIMDKLEVSPNSRAKVLPPTEKHLLYQVHLHGGTSSQLDWYNKPDESLEAIQFYHFKATREKDPDPGAAMTLATYYHYGYRGIQQNLTLALQYYDVAAQAASWEAAGLAGWFHVFGLGMDGKDRDLYQAHKYFRMGLIGGLKGCKERHQKKKQSKQQDTITQCDPSCLNGMGLLHMFGVPLAVEKDASDAMEYFTLAKDMGHSDAAYNLAMVTMGWKHNYVPTDEAVDPAEIKISGVDENGKVIKSTTVIHRDPGVTKLDLPSFMEPENQMAPGPSTFDMKQVVQYLMIAVQKGHLQARHRLALLYDTGVLSTTEDPSKGRITRRTGSQRLKEVLPQDCDMALKHYKTIVEVASPHVLHRLRSAYKDYIAGDSASSLIQYMSLAELGNDVAQVNAAFLLEQGTCLGLSPTDCHKASVRYWKAAAEVGNAEACLRVGDFYYYGKLRAAEDPLASMWDRPFGWAQYVIFPERHLLPAVTTTVQDLIQEVTILALEGSGEGSNSENDMGASEAGVDGICSSNGEEGTCANEDTEIEMVDEGELQKKRLEENERDLKMAAHYYRIAAEKHASPRANYNLAFLHEWGLGLTQDFPLAKRHYDLAASSVAATREADLAVQIALWTLAFHEYVVRLKMAWEDYWGVDGDGAASGSSTIIDAVPRVISELIGKPVPGPTAFTNNKAKKTKADVVWGHIWSWDSLPILILTIVLTMLIQRVLMYPR